MVRMLRDDEVIQKIIERKMVLAMTQTDGDVYNMGRIKGLEDAIKEIQSCYPIDSHSSEQMQKSNGSETK